MASVDSMIREMEENEVSIERLRLGGRERTRHSRRGRLGIRSPILRVMDSRPDGPWSPQEVCLQLPSVGTTASRASVLKTMRRMDCDGEIVKVAHGAYRLPESREEPATE
jgi:hypothetical protein